MTHEESETIPTAAVLDLIHRLAGIAAWQPIGTLLEQARLSLAGADGLTMNDLRRMRVWAERWEALHPKIASFLIENLYIDNQLISSALWALLEGTDGPIQGALHGRIKKLWHAWDGAECDFDIPYRRRRRQR